MLSCRQTTISCPSGMHSCTEVEDADEQPQTAALHVVNVHLHLSELKKADDTRLPDGKI